jgi:outer membrane protein OmpA-like peptidoglycan-associated protein
MKKINTGVRGIFLITVLALLASMATGCASTKKIIPLIGGENIVTTATVTEADSYATKAELKDLSARLEAAIAAGDKANTDAILAEARARIAGDANLQTQYAGLAERMKVLEGNIGQVRKMVSVLDETAKRTGENADAVRFGRDWLTTPIFFGVGETGLTDRRQGLIAEAAKAGDWSKAVIVGYADPSGSRADNNRLAKARAESVKAGLATAGVDVSGVTVEVGGETTRFGFYEANNRVVVIHRPPKP